MLLLVFIGTACAPKYPDSWSGKLDVASLADEQAQLVASSLADWRAASGGLVTASVSRTGGLPVIEGDAGEGHGAIYYDSPGMKHSITIAPWLCDTTSADCEQAIKHEIGHWLGARHVDDPGAVMYKNITGARRLVDADIDALFAAVED